MFKSFKFWLSIGLIIALVVCFVTDGFGVKIDVDYVTAIISVALSVMIMLGVIDKDLPAKTGVKDIQNQLKSAKDDLILKDDAKNDFTRLEELDSKNK